MSQTTQKMPCNRYIYFLTIEMTSSSSNTCVNPTRSRKFRENVEGWYEGYGEQICPIL